MFQELNDLINFNLSYHKVYSIKIEYRNYFVYLFYYFVVHIKRETCE